MAQNNWNFMHKFKAGIFFFWEYPKFQGETFRDAMKYILILGLIVGIPTVLPRSLESQRVANRKLQWIEKKAPDFKVEDGELHVSGETPIIDRENEAVFAVDTTGTLDVEKTFKDYRYGLILTKDRMLNKDGFVKSRLYSEMQKPLGGKDLAKKELVQVLGLKMMGLYSFFPLLLKYYLDIFFSALIIGLCGLIAGKWLAIKLRFADLYRLSLFALTLPMIFALLISFLPLRSLLFTGIYYAIASVFLIRVVARTNSSQKAALPGEKGN